jgi:hypothetical protein
MRHLLSRRWRRLRASAQAGLTLAELVVSMGLTTVIGAMALTLFVNINTSSGDTTDRSILVGQARDVLQAWSGYLQVADGTTAGATSHRIEWLTSTDLLFHADIDNRSTTATVAATAPDVVWLRLYGSQLVEERSHGGSTTCRTLADHVTVTSLFTAYDSTGTSMASQDLGTAPSASGRCAGLPSSYGQSATSIANLQNVSDVKIDFSITDTRGDRTQEFTSTVALPSLGGALS